MGNSEPVKDLPDKIEFMNCSVVSRMNQHPRIPSNTTGRMPYLFGIHKFRFFRSRESGYVPIKQADCRKRKAIQSRKTFSPGYLPRKTNEK